MIYLDNAASTPCLPCVMDAMQDVNKQWSNVHRGFHSYAECTTTAYEEARKRVAAFLHADNNQVAFTSGTTDSLNIIAHGLGLSSNDCVLATEMDHHSNILPWQVVGCKIILAPINDGLLNLDAFRDLLHEHRPKVVTFPTVSNVLGTATPYDEISRLARDAGAIVIVDAAQGILKRLHETCFMDIDFMAFSGHKMGGPTGVGVLWGKDLNTLRPFRFGGGMVADINPPLFSTKSAPHKLEAGTPPIQQAIGLGEACRFWEKIGQVKVHQKVWKLTAYAHWQLSAIPGINIIGPSIGQKISIVSFTVDGIHAHDVADLLSRRGIAVRAGHHCALPLHRALGITASVRVSFSYFNTMEDIDALIGALAEIQGEFK